MFEIRGRTDGSATGEHALCRSDWRIHMQSTIGCKRRTPTSYKRRGFRWRRGSWSEEDNEVTEEKSVSSAAKTVLEHVSMHEVAVART